MSRQTEARESFFRLVELRAAQNKTLAQLLRECVAAIQPPSPFGAAEQIRTRRERKAALLKVLPEVIRMLEGEEK